MIPRNGWAYIGVAVVSFALLTAFKAHSSPGLQLVVAPVALLYMACLAASAFDVPRNWKTYGLRSLVPAVACVAAALGAYPAGAFFQAHFFSENFARFQAVVSGVSAMPLRSDGAPEPIPVNSEDKEQIQEIFAQREPDGALLVEIDTENGFPAKHSGYIFVSSGTLPVDHRFQYRWPYTEQLRPKWFRVSN